MRVKWIDGVYRDKRIMQAFYNFWSQQDGMLGREYEDEKYELLNAKLAEWNCIITKHYYEFQSIEDVVVFLTTWEE